MDVKDTVKELFEPTFEAIGDGELSYEQKRTLLYNLYCFACAIYPEYVANPSKTLFEYGCCFLLEPERHPDYETNKAAFTRTAASVETLEGGGRWYVRDGKDFIKYDYGSSLFERVIDIIPPQDKSPLPQLSLYAAVYLACSLYKQLQPLWFTYYFYLDATNEPLDEEFDGKMNALLHNEHLYAHAAEIKGSMLIGDEVELAGSEKLLAWYKPFIDWRREHIFDVFEKRMNGGDAEFVAEYSSELIKCYPENVGLMNWNAASRTECVIRSKNYDELKQLVIDLRDYAEASDSPVVKKYLQLAELMKKNIDNSK